MRLQVLSPAKSLNKAFLKQSLKREEIELFKANLIILFNRINEKESEENLKNIVSDFLKDTWYKNSHEINTKNRTDMVIHNGKSAADTVGVIIEVKRPANKTEMITPDRPNTKAMHELLHYYMQERYIRDNKEIKRLIICNIYEWYIFDAADFERFFFENQRFVKTYRSWNEGQFCGTNTDWFYQEIAKGFIEENAAGIPCTCFDLRVFERIARNPAKIEDTQLINLYKIFSPIHLLKQPVANDSNSLNKEFYSELLYILGLEEIREKGRKLIRRKPAGDQRQDASLLEDTYAFLKNRNRLSSISNPQQYGATEEEQLFSIALELCITWLNRLLFLKLLEGQLIAYHKGDRAYAFLSSNRIEDFDELNELFFDVLAVRVEDRSASVKAKFGNIPYLNSSLFEESDLERATLRINELRNRLDLPLYRSTVLKEANGKRCTGAKKTLQYFFEFLDAYDFGTEGAEIRENNKTIINASVLGLIFEKINGYRDGSFFTPGFITMHTCHKVLRDAVRQKFNEQYGWACKDFIELFNKMDTISIREANEVVNSLRVCDPAVGSGHFLVSSLNEIIVIKAELRILADQEGKRLSGYSVAIENDELIIVSDDHIFQYNFKDPESQRVQETLFHEKETIIENCLFGVDINPKSVAICRLRLWIELLKNAYYRPQMPTSPEERHIETLPNIDINIKCGNSLVSRFALSGNAHILAGERKKLKELTEKYRRHVFEYKLSPSNKSQLRRVIDGLKEDLQRFGLPSDKDLISLRKKENEVAQLRFAFDKKGIAANKKLLAEVIKLKELYEEKQRSIYVKAFEWRFEFPEVLDENGEFIGFDVVIGNPPYVRIQDLQKCSPNEVTFYKTRYRTAAKGNYDIYALFVEKGLSLLNKNGHFVYILPHRFFNAGYGEQLRKLISEGRHLSEIVHFGHQFIFEEAAAYTCLLFMEKQGQEQFIFTKVYDVKGWRNHQPGATTTGTILATAATASEWNFSLGDNAALLKRLSALPVTLEDAATRIFQGLKTSGDKVFIVEEKVRTNEGRVKIFSPKKQAEYWLEEDLLHPLVKGGDSAAYQLTRTNRLILFPYETVMNGKGALINDEVLQERYPLTWAYLVDNKDFLEAREDGKICDVCWYGYGRSQALDVMMLPKIFTPDLALSPSFSLDDTGDCFFTGGTAGGYGITLNAEYDWSYILGILNSKLCEWFINQISPQMRAGWLSFESRFIKHIPIQKASEAQETAIVERVEKILEDPGSASATKLVTEIDQLIYEIYELTPDEIAVVEGY